MKKSTTTALLLLTVCSATALFWQYSKLDSAYRHLKAGLSKSDVESMFGWIPDDKACNGRDIDNSHGWTLFANPNLCAEKLTYRWPITCEEWIIALDKDGRIVAHTYV